MIPVTIIGGYLGAGKTTLINHMLRHANGLRIAVMVNDFGALPIDADLIEGAQDGLISLAGGCVCCAFGDNLSGAVADLVARDPQPEHIVIETSGVALPGATMANLSLMQGIRPEGSVVLVDAETIQKQARDKYVGDTVQRQIADAGVLVVTKSDLAPPERLEEVAIWLTKVAPSAGVVTAINGNVPNDVLLGALTPRPSSQAQSDAHAKFETLVIRPAPTDPETLAMTLAENDKGIVRAKGFFTGADGAVFLLQIVGKRWNIEPSQRQDASGVVCIGLKDQLNRDALMKL